MAFLLIAALGLGAVVATDIFQIGRGRQVLLQHAWTWNASARDGFQGSVPASTRLC
jgi:hypothetical protein